jgi:hypothetical protein
LPHNGTTTGASCLDLNLQIASSNRGSRIDPRHASGIHFPPTLTLANGPTYIAPAVRQGKRHRFACPPDDYAPHAQRITVRTLGAA